jgi:dTDP-4-amino-4,6-dideoxygalactose transaminase
MQVPPFSLTDQLADLGSELDDAVLRVLRSGQYIGGAEIKKFEDAFAASVNCSHAVGCNSGTDALVLALRGLGIGSGDEVITASFSFFATAEAISAVGATPVFVDVDPVTYLIDLNLIEAAITPATKVLLPVHLFGRPVDMARITDIAQRHGLRVVEDCAQATGASWDSKPVGSWGDVGCFSFFPTKNLGAAGDGGAMTCQDNDLAQRMRELAVHGMPRRYLHTALGYNSRLDSIQAAVLNVKLPHLNEWVEKRAAIAKRYLEALKDLPSVQLPDSAAETSVGHGWNQFVVRVGLCPNNQPTCDRSCSESANTLGLPSSRCRDWLKQSLQEQGVNTIIYYPIPIHRQPAYDFQKHSENNLPITDQLCSEVLSLPIFPELTTEQQERVIAVLREQLVAQSQERMVA